MTITVRDLIRLPHLRFTVVAGDAGLDSAVSWVHTSDLPEPWKWHGVGELLLTNTVGLPAEETEQVQFVERLSECGASGLGIGLGLSGPSLLVGALRRADELALPLLTVPLSTPFTAIVRAVADANSREESRQLWRVSRLYELLRTSGADGSSGQDLFRKLGEELGVQLSVVDPATGHSLFGEGECRYAAELAAGYGTHGNTLPAMLPLRSAAPHADPGAVAAVAVAMPGEPPTALVVESTDGQLPSMVLLHHVAVGGALELTRLTESQERERQLGANTLTRLLDRRIDSHAAQLQLAELGLDLADCVLVAARAAGDGAAAHRRLAATRVPHALLHRDDTVYLLLPATALNTALAAEIWPSPGGGTAGLGVSDRITTPNRVADAAQEARWALAVVGASGQRTAHYGDDSMTLPPRTPAEARVLVSRILAPLIRHDAQHGTNYVATLQAFLQTDRSWQGAAAELHVHRQTLGYRLRKIEQLTGRGVTRTDHIAQWWLALRARDLLAGQPGDR
jgi:PucR family transcriptional regulator, purine catabolism regulatory protein